MRNSIQFTLILLLLASVAAVPLTLQATVEQPPADAGATSSTLAGPTISQIQITNVRDVSFTVSWLTDTPTAGHVNYGPTTALGATAYDDRGAGTTDDTHHVTLSNLDPNTTYHFDIVSGATLDDNGGAHYSVTTGPTLDLQTPDAIYGQAFLEDGSTPATGALVYVTVKDNDGSGSAGESALMSGLVNTSGYWSVNLANSRTAGLAAPFDYSSSGDNVVVEAEGGTDGTATQTVDTASGTPAANMILSTTSGPCYDLDDSGSVGVGDFAVMDDLWRATDAESLALGDFNKNDVVDVGDFITLGMHFGESSCSPE